MKEIRSISIILVALAVVSCSDSFLDIPVQGGVTTESDPNLAPKLVTGVYNSLTVGDSWGEKGDVHGFALISVTNIMSDDASKGSTLSDQQVPVGDIDEFSITPTNKFAETLWSGHYNSIGAANQALKALEVATIDATAKARAQGEVRFLRGYLYFNLVRIYGGVPLVLRVPVDAADANGDPAFQTRASVDQIYDAIIGDLQFAGENLVNRLQSTVGHANKGAAQAMLAKVYMYRQNWAKVRELTDAVIASNQYSLLPDYGTIWRQSAENSVESIFEIQTGQFNNANLKIDNYTVCQGVRVGGFGGWNDLGWGFNNPTPELVNAYEPGDVRRDATIITIDTSPAHKGTVLWDGFRVPSADSVQNRFYNYKAYTSAEREKYADPKDKDRPKNVRILRYAEVLLMSAEAAVHLGGDAATPLNLVRVRAKLLPKAVVTINDVWQERRLELAMEHDRFWDIVRQGRAAEVMHGAGKTNFVAGKHELMPIPISQILLSAGQLAQNPGY